jgi:hypothetical protein
MKSVRSLSLLALVLAWHGSALAAPKPQPAKPENDHFRLSDLLPRSLNPNPRVGVSVITEMTPDGKAMTPPDPAHPAYYALWDGGIVEAGDLIAGEVPPKKERLAAMMEHALGGSGYLPTTKEHPPTVVIYYRWGSYNHLTPLDDNDPMGETAVRKNVFTRAAIVGGVDFAREMMRAENNGTINFFRMSGPDHDELMDMATGDLYFVVAIGFDGTAAKSGKSKRLWTTKISASSEGLAMDETLPALATSGRMLFGHETKGPVLTSPRLFGGKVEVGPTVIIDDSAKTPPRPADPQPKK